MKKKTSLLIGISLLMIAVCYIGYAVNHPEASFPWSNRVTYMLYGIYGWVVFKFFVEAIRKKPSNGSLIKAVVSFFLAIVFFIMEITGETVNFYTIVRGFIVIGGLDIGIENLSLWMKQRKK